MAKIYEHDGRSLTLREWAAEFGISNFEMHASWVAGYTIAEIGAGKRTQRKQSYRRWTPSEEARLREMHDAGESERTIAEELGRSMLAVRARLKHL